VRIARIDVSRSALLLLVLCLLDTISSALLFQHNLAIEANPLLRGPAEAGMLPFISAKTLTFLPAIAVAEWYRRSQPRFVETLLKVTSVAYAAIYAALVGIQFIA